MDESRVDAREAKCVEVKPLWTDADYHDMSWHDCPVHAMAFVDDNEGINCDDPLPGILFDLDYIFEWKLNEVENFYKFYIAPCTLFFENVFGYEIIGLSSIICPYRPEINNISLSILRNEPEIPYKNYQCEIDFHSSGTMRFQTTGYKQYVRKIPVLSAQQSLVVSVRGGICFDRRVDGAIKNQH